MKNKFKLFVLLTLCFFLFPAFTVFANVELDYLKVDVATDKESYEAGEEITYTLTVTNQTGSKANNVVVTANIPEGLEVTSTDPKITDNQLVWNIESLNSFGETQVSFTAKTIKQSSAPPPVTPEVKKPTKGTSPKTGDDTSFTKYYVLLGISLAVLILALFVLNKERFRKQVTLLIIFGLVASSFGTIAKAEEKEEKYKNEAVHKMKVGDKEYQVTTTVEAMIDINETDFDTDGLTNEFEEAAKDTSKFNPYKRDSDGNGIPDGEEDYDQDGLKNIDEQKAGTNPFQADSDGDGLKDGYEVSFNQPEKLNPLLKDSDENEIPDGEEDYDEDGLKNSEEQKYGTNPFESDSDGDGLSDYDEINTHKTNPALEDTDGDGLTDDSELTLGLDPLKQDTDGNGIKDSEEVITQPISEEVMNKVIDPKTGVIPSLLVKGKGDINKNITIGFEENNFIRNNPGLVSAPISIELPTDFESAQIGFKITSNVLASSRFSDLVIAYFDEEKNQWVPVETTHDAGNNIISAETTHFSTWGVLDIVAFVRNWQIMGDSSDSTVQTGQADISFIIDSTGSMYEEINNVKLNIQNFVEELKEKNVDVRLGIIDYKDIDADGEDSTVDRQWHYEITNFLESLGAIVVDGGGDTPESVVDALEMGRRSGFRDTATKFMVLLTDADYNESNNYGVASMEEEIQLLKNDDISVSVITDDYYRPVYEALYTETGGVFANIYGDFANELLSLTDLIQEGTNDGTWIRLSDGTTAKLLKNPKDGDMSVDSDGDGLPDLQELIKEETITLPTWALIFLQLRFPGQEFSPTVKVWTYKSHPLMKDSDGDGILDNADELPLRR
ncbi:VWA domain-containing protein [Fredinandcohnia sp. 179-A 10B2 NHS]|uniref:VWA domain-containing protein n=1 Tax=Fredinandcohnia sp. 179-A 10B2 NHS TaxID=3235176 RepID=UPI0039A0AD78